MPKGVYLHTIRQPLAQRFWSKVQITADNDCWLWKAGGRVGPYGGLMMPNKRPIGAHKMAWLLTHGPIPDGLSVRHTCDIPLCCNPKHLFLGTHTDNMRDMTAKGRNHQTRKTLCPRGHAYTPENTIHPRGNPNWRWCRTCAAAAKTKHRRQQKEQTIYG